MAHVLSATDDPASAVVAAATRGDVAALERIIARHHRDMARVCVVICGGDADLAEDAVQTAWPIAWRKLHQLRDPERLRPWLVSIAANEARHLVRRRGHHVVEIAVADTASSTGDPDSASDTIDLRVALRRLGPDDRTLLALRHVAGFDSSEIAPLMGLSASGVRTRLERLLARLRKELGDD